MPALYSHAIQNRSHKCPRIRKRTYPYYVTCLGEGIFKIPRLVTGRRVGLLSCSQCLLSKPWKHVLSRETRYTVRNLYVLLALEVFDFFLYDGRSLTSAYSSCCGGGCHLTPNCVSWMMRSISKIYKTDSQCFKGQRFLDTNTVTLSKRSAICWWANFHSPLYVFSWISTNRSAFFSCRSTSCFSFSFSSRSKGTFDLNSVSVSLRIFRLVDKTSCNLIGRKNNKYGKPFVNY